MRRLLEAYPLILGGVVSALLVAPVGFGGQLHVGAWLYIGIVVAAVTFVLDRLLRIPFDRWAPAGALFWIPISASATGILAGWLAINYTMGGPVTT